MGFAIIALVRTSLCMPTAYVVNKTGVGDGPGPKFRGPSERQSMTTDVEQLYEIPVQSATP